MAPGAGRFRAEWAWESKLAGQARDYDVLACSGPDGWKPNYRAQIGLLAVGDMLTFETDPQAAVRPWVSFGIRTGDIRRVDLVIRDWAGRQDAAQRDIQDLRYFAVPYATLAEVGAGYRAIFEALQPVDLAQQRPGEPLVEREVQGDTGEASIGRAIQEGATDFVLHVAALLLEGRVALTEPGGADIWQRLEWLDLVVGCLPYGVRGDLRVATWLRSNSPNDRIRLAFTGAAVGDQVEVDWRMRRAPALSPSGIADRCYKLLSDQVMASDLRSVMDALRRERDPLTFDDPEQVLSVIRALRLPKATLYRVRACQPADGQSYWRGKESEIDGVRDEAVALIQSRADYNDDLDEAHWAEIVTFIVRRLSPTAITALQTYAQSYSSPDIAVLAVHCIQQYLSATSGGSAPLPVPELYRALIAGLDADGRARSIEELMAHALRPRAAQDLKKIAGLVASWITVLPEQQRAALYGQLAENRLLAQELITQEPAAAEGHLGALARAARPGEPRPLLPWQIAYGLQREDLPRDAVDRLAQDDESYPSLVLEQAIAHGSSAFAHVLPGIYSWLVARGGHVSPSAALPRWHELLDNAAAEARGESDREAKLDILRLLLADSDAPWFASRRLAGPEDNAGPYAVAVADHINGLDADTRRRVSSRFMTWFPQFADRDSVGNVLSLLNLLTPDDPAALSSEARAAVRATVERALKIDPNLKSTREFQTRWAPFLPESKTVSVEDLRTRIQNMLSEPRSTANIALYALAKPAALFLAACWHQFGGESGARKIEDQIADIVATLVDAQVFDEDVWSIQADSFRLAVQACLLQQRMDPSIVTELVNMVRIRLVMETGAFVSSYKSHTMEELYDAARLLQMLPDQEKGLTEREQACLDFVIETLKDVARTPRVPVYQPIKNIAGGAAQAVKRNFTKPRNIPNNETVYAKSKPPHAYENRLKREEQRKNQSQDD
jgi:hypothetical protein